MASATPDLWLYIPSQRASFFGRCQNTAWYNKNAILCQNVSSSSAEMEMGQWVMGHGSNGSPLLDGSRGSWVIASDPLTHDDKITAQ